jgi:hypothetical protein
MDGSAFEFEVAMPRDARYGEAVRRLALQAVSYAGGAAGDAEAFAASVEQAFQTSVSGSGGNVALTFRRAAGPVEVIIDGRVLSLAV